MVKPIKERLKEKMKERGIKTPALSEQTGIPKDRIYAWYRDDTNPKADDLAILESWLSGELSNNSEEMVARETNNSNKPSVIPEWATESDYLKAILALTESNKGLQETNQTVTNTNRVIADTNALLAQRLVNNQTTATEDRQTFDETVATVIALKESLIEISAGLKKVSKVDAIKDFHNKVRAAMNKIGNKDSRAEVSKQSI